VDVLHPRNATSCEFQQGVTTGVLCCKRKKKGGKDRKKPGKTK
jgi:hypothetical protein